MATITVKNLSDELHERLKRRAARHGRSLNGEIIECLKDAVDVRPLDPEALLVQARGIRSRISGRLTPERAADLRRHRL